MVKKIGWGILLTLVLVGTLTPAIFLLPVAGQPVTELWSYTSSSPVTDITAPTNRGWLAYGTEAGEIKVLNNKGGVEWSKTGSGGPISSIIISDDGSNVRAGGGDGYLYWFVLSSGSLTAVQYSQIFYAIDATPDLEKIVTLSSYQPPDGTYYISIWDSNKNLLSDEEVNEPLDLEQKAISISDDGGLIVVNGWNGGFDGDTGHLLWTAEVSNVIGAHTSIDGSLAAFASETGYVHLIDGVDGSELWKKETTNPAVVVKISNDKEYVAVGTDLFKGAGGDVCNVHLFDIEGTSLWNHTASGTILDIAISPDSKYVMAASEDGNLYFLDIRDGEPIDNHDLGKPVLDVTISPNGNYIAANTGDKVYVFPKPNLRPDASFTCPNTEEVNTPITFDASSSNDPDGTIDYYDWDFDDDNTTTVTTATITHTYTTTGTYTVNLTVTDDDGKKDSYTETITITPTVSAGDPVASFTFSPVSPEEGETVTFNASGSSDSDGQIENYSWDFGDDNTTSGAAATVTHAYETAGSYDVVLTVTDDDEFTDTETQTITVRIPGSEIDDEPPVANAGSNITVSIGSKVTFSAANSTDNVGITSYSWDFGDDNSATGETVSHTYGTVGNYTVTLTVADAAGNYDTVTITITVEEAAAGFPYWIILVVVLIVVAAVAIWYFLKKRKPKEKVPKPARIKLTAEPTELMADGKSTSTLTIELLDEKEKPISALDDTEIKLTSSMGTIEKTEITIPKGKQSEKTILTSSKTAGTAKLSADAKDLKSKITIITFKEKKRYCMHCGAKMPFTAKRCPECQKSPPAGVDTKTCKNCNAVIPVVAKFCAECGASQPK